jgi:predicted transcriptional regulator
MTNNILISIYPRYMEKIINKQKTLNLEISILPQILINIFWIYETIPTKALKYKLIVKIQLLNLRKINTTF